MNSLAVYACISSQQQQDEDQEQFDDTFLPQPHEHPFEMSTTTNCSNGGAGPLQLVLPNTPAQCSWTCPAAAAATVGLQTGRCPHTTVFQPPNAPARIMNSILDAVGWTPLVRLDRLAAYAGLQCQLLAKCEFLNPGGSLKDRIAVRMIEEAERAGLITHGVSTIIEPTSGNTGIGLAMAAAVKGYRCIICMPEKMSREKSDILKALGAEIVRTPTTAPYHSLESHHGVAQRLQRIIPNSIVFDQYRNVYNAMAHYDQTAQEIIEQTNGDVQMVVCGAGTGGTITGVGRKFKTLLPHCRIVGVDPLGSIIAPLNLTKNENDKNLSKDIEGIGHDYLPTSLDRSVVDEWFKSNDRDSFHMARQLIQREGLLCGGSSGAVVCAALHCARSLQPHERCVLILPDSVRNYMTKFLSDDWMQQRQLQQISPSKDDDDDDWKNFLVQSTLLREPLCCSLPKISTTTTTSNALQIMHECNVQQLPVINDDGLLIGIVTLDKLKTVSPDASSVCSQFMYDKFIVVNCSSGNSGSGGCGDKAATLTLRQLMTALVEHGAHFAVLTTTRRGNNDCETIKVGRRVKMNNKSAISGGDSSIVKIVTAVDIFDVVACARFIQ